MNQEAQKSFGGKSGKSGTSNRKIYCLPRETFAGERSKGVSRSHSTADTSPTKGETKLEGPNLLTKAARRFVNAKGNSKSLKQSDDGIIRKFTRS